MHVFYVVSLESNKPEEKLKKKQFFSHVGVEPILPEFNRATVGS